MRDRVKVAPINLQTKVCIDENASSRNLNLIKIYLNSEVHN